jgi:hypothetical protein
MGKRAKEAAETEERARSSIGLILPFQSFSGLSLNRLSLVDGAGIRGR